MLISFTFSVIKAMASGGCASPLLPRRSRLADSASPPVMTTNSHPAKPSYSQAELTAMAEESHKFNIPITTHATGTEFDPSGRRGGV